MSKKSLEFLPIGVSKFVCVNIGSFFHELQNKCCFVKNMPDLFTKQHLDFRIRPAQQMSGRSRACRVARCDTLPLPQQLGSGVFGVNLVDDAFEHSLGGEHEGFAEGPHAGLAAKLFLAPGSESL